MKNNERWYAFDHKITNAEMPLVIATLTAAYGRPINCSSVSCPPDCLYWMQGTDGKPCDAFISTRNARAAWTASYPNQISERI